MVQTNIVEKIKTHILCSITFFEDHTVYEILMSKIVVETRGATNGVTVWRIRIACCISKATCTCPRVCVPISTDPHARIHNRPISNSYCFSTATMIREHASMLRYTYVALLLCLLNNVVPETIYHSMPGWLENSEFERSRKEAFGALYDVVFWHIYAEVWANHDGSQVSEWTGPVLNPGHQKYAAKWYSFSVFFNGSFSNII